MRSGCLSTRCTIRRLQDETAQSRTKQHLRYECSDVSDQRAQRHDLQIERQRAAFDRLRACRCLLGCHDNSYGRPKFQFCKGDKSRAYPLSVASVDSLSTDYRTLLEACGVFDRSERGLN